MRRVPLAALLRLLIIAGGATFVNPYVSEDRVDLNQVWVEIPSTLVALGGDVHIRVHGASGTGIRVRLAREDDEGRALLATMPLALDFENRMTLPCGYFSRGGTYYLELLSEKDTYLPDFDNTTELAKREVENKVKREIGDGSLMETSDSVVKSWKFDVLWPSATLDVTPEQIQTYPERQVMAILEFPRVVCTPVESSADFWIELLYCGHSSGGAVLCDGKNTSSHAHVLYSEQMQGFPGRKTMTLRCELFGQAGDYALTLRPAAAAGPQDLATAFIKADWSDQFVLNVHGGSVFPCGDGVRVLFQYPECVLEGTDRVRVFGRDAERLRYIAEKRVRRGQHTATFECRLFSERYPEYCFVYVSQAVTGAVADVRMDCLPTLPLSDGGAGGWGEWSAWSACPAPAHCSTRTRSRHRFCDSPPPAYGAKLCEGQAVELAACECSARPWAGDSSMVVAEVGARCRCGCVLHLAPAARLLAGSAKACPSRSFWLLQVLCALAFLASGSYQKNLGQNLNTYVSQTSVSRAIKIVINALSHPNILKKYIKFPQNISERQMLKEKYPYAKRSPFYGPTVVTLLNLADISICLLATESDTPQVYAKLAEEGLVVRLRLEAVKLPCAGQSLRARDGDSLGSPLLASWDGPESTPMVGDVETTTDSSGVLEIAGGRHILVELRSGDTSDRCAGGFLAHATQVEPIRNASAAWASVSGGIWWRSGGGARGAAVALAAAAALAALCLALHSAHRTRAYQRAADKESLTDSDACSASLELGGAASGSRSTLLSEVVGGGVSLRRLLPSGRTRHTRLRDSDRNSENVEQRDEEDNGTDIEADAADNISVVSAESVASQATVTPETVSSSSAPVGRNVVIPSPLRRSRTISASNVAQPQVKVCASPPQPSTSESGVVEMSTSISSVSERESTCSSEKDRDSMWDKDRSESRASSSTSAATLTNGWYSPALSGVAAAKIRDNPKHTKESCNRRLLKSDLSLTSHPEMEIDYYDYEVNNAGSVPGSYLGMDPAFLVWIPPLEEGDILKEIGETKAPVYEEILPKGMHPDPGSNTESPEDRPSSSTLKRVPDNRTNRSNESIKSIRKVMEKGNIIHPLNFSISDLQNSPKLSKRNKKKKVESPVTIQMKDLTLTRSPVRVHRKENRSDFDTSTLKRITDSKEKDSGTLKRTDFSDIRFADENSDSSNEIKFADDSPDSNRIVDKYNVKT